MRLSQLPRPANVAAIALIAALAMAAPSWTPQAVAQTPPQTAPQAGPLTSTDKDIETVTAAVTAINATTRTVTIKMADGTSVDVIAGAGAYNFGNVKVGDKVVATLEFSLNFTVLPVGTKLPPVAVLDQAARAKPGQKPAAGIAQTTQITAVIVAIDVPGKTVSVVDRAGGPIRVLKVMNPERQAMLPKVKVGQVLVITYTEALAIEVRPAV